MHFIVVSLHISFLHTYYRYSKFIIPSISLYDHLVGWFTWFSKFILSFRKVVLPFRIQKAFTWHVLCFLYHSITFYFLYRCSFNSQNPLTRPSIRLVPVRRSFHEPNYLYVFLVPRLFLLLNPKINFVIVKSVILLLTTFWLYRFLLIPQCILEQI